MRARESKRRDLLRARAGYACEYCRVTETLMGGRLTEDHIIPLIGLIEGTGRVNYE